MSIFQSLNTTASALTAQRLRMDVISSNMANVDTTRAQFVDGQWQPYRRKMVVLEPNEGGFSSYLQKAIDGQASVGGGVRVAKIVEDETPFKLVYDPTNPDANQDGYVQLPNVDPLKEMVDLMSATRSYEANVTVFNATKGMLVKALEIGK
ncbi:flagellar basal-body rod protein FlgC [Anoxybacillus sp. B7M1]|jgi:flagellar basal-body rod protein FlgC|uniref:Flagellar basal-body rod protein FlgC n=1 Tax=Anoxybacteroides rupiense TaxID=311460 RepID=A0ABD5IRF5_9BACL|nr:MULTISPECIES: flagellar basal body rod protein FlgC [Anoxybacillus]ANB57040.1 flagellar basal-body rod protein FlgC [Anoxybacillus sp. B2M1]ANB64306.1 flagellar basal-body rod protein FlgC [Anoxybacillus sp. B7M1]KXG10544.1 Flagellar basal-body rod protein FlgC [Anoxybacillus sp. P3H1B]MBB3906172.1 flagellar basal-body rod protein FlgC [Anoxybacillus rupiensis]MBS2771003.1 flagellar basal body rod protein FlgC [Anoxybacillus rupiensis]